MGSSVSIIMYHYVRDLAASEFPEIKGLDVKLFEAQLDYIQKHYAVINAAQLLDAIEEGEVLPENALLLSFDDGYSDHYKYVYPILKSRGLTGCFFPPARCILENQVLDVNKIHFLLASVQDKDLIVKSIYAALDANREKYGLREIDYYWNNIDPNNRYDTKDVNFIKCVLQVLLPEELRNIVVDKLFKEFVTDDESAFAKELYLSLEQISEMKDNGMYFGSHGYDHYWLDSLNQEQQIVEIDRSLEFLQQIGVDITQWIMCYPYGAYNDSLLDILKQRNCKIGLSTNVDIASLDVHDPLTLPRLDTNDLPKDANSDPSEWTKKALQQSVS